MQIGPLEEYNIHGVISLWERAGLTRPWNDPYRDAKFARGKANSEILIGKERGEIVASVLVGHDGHRGALYYLAVCPKYRGRGYGRQIVEAAEAWLRERGVWKINLLVREDSQSVLTFYAKLGYEPGATIQFGRRLDSSQELSEMADRSWAQAVKRPSRLWRQAAHAGHYADEENYVQRRGSPDICVVRRGWHFGRFSCLGRYMLSGSNSGASRC